MSLLFPLSANADIIILNNGKKIKTIRAWTEGDQVKCYRFGAIIGYPKENVKRIEEEPDENFEQVMLPRKETQSKGDKPDFSQEDENVHNASLGQFRVDKIYDGDSFKATGYHIAVKVRFVGIDAPETANKRKKKPAQPYSEDAKRYLENMILNKMVHIRGYGLDMYNRQLAEVFVGRKNIGLEMVRAGFAEIYQGKFPKDFTPGPYRKSELQARESRKGMWALGRGYVSPKKWRKMYKNRN